MYIVGKDSSSVVIKIQISNLWVKSKRNRFQIIAIDCGCLVIATMNSC